MFQRNGHAIAGIISGMPCGTTSQRVDLSLFRSCLCPTDKPFELDGFLSKETVPGF